MGKLPKKCRKKFSEIPLNSREARKINLEGINFNVFFKFLEKLRANGELITKILKNL